MLEAQCEIEEEVKLKEGIILKPGEARSVSLRGNQLEFLVTGEHSKRCTVYSYTLQPGFNAGLHYHTKFEEMFYVVEGELSFRLGDKVVHGGPGTFMFVPPRIAHEISNPGPEIARMLMINTPPGYERYFQKVADVFAKEGPLDTEMIAELRREYDTVQVTPPRTR